MKRALFAAATLLAAAACEEVAGPDECSLMPFIRPSLQVTVEDSVTGANVTPGSTLVLRRGGVPVDSVTVPPGAPDMPVWGGSGTFTLSVRQTGYQSWVRTGIEVGDDGCDALTVDVTARLKPAA